MLAAEMSVWPLQQQRRRKREEMLVLHIWSVVEAAVTETSVKSKRFELHLHSRS